MTINHHKQPTSKDQMHACKHCTFGLRSPIRMNNHQITCLDPSRVVRFSATEHTMKVLVDLSLASVVLGLRSACNGYWRLLIPNDAWWWVMMVDAQSWLMISSHGCEMMTGDGVVDAQRWLMVGNDGRWCSIWSVRSSCLWCHHCSHPRVPGVCAQAIG